MNSSIRLDEKDRLIITFSKSRDIPEEIAEIIGLSQPSVGRIKKLKDRHTFPYCGYEF